MPQRNTKDVFHSVRGIENASSKFQPYFRGQLLIGTCLHSFFKAEAVSKVGDEYAFTKLKTDASR